MFEISQLPTTSVSLSDIERLLIEKLRSTLAASIAHSITTEVMDSIRRHLRTEDASAAMRIERRNNALWPGHKHLAIEAVGPDGKATGVRGLAIPDRERAYPSLDLSITSQFVRLSPEQAGQLAEQLQTFSMSGRLPSVPEATA